MKFEDTTKEAYVDLGFEQEDTIATPKLEMHFIELKKFREKEPNLANNLEQWLYLISGGEENKIKMIEKENKEIKKTVSIIDKMSMSEEEWELYESRRIATMLYNTGMKNAEERGLEKGLEKRKRRTE